MDMVAMSETNEMLNTGGQGIYAIGMLINIISLLFYISTAYGLYLINKKLGEKHAWLSFVPIIQIYNYCTASKKSILHYFVLPIVAIIVGVILTPFTFGISAIVAYIYFIVMWIKLLHAISIRTGRGAWTTVGLLFVGAIMFPIVGIKLEATNTVKKEEDKEKTENSTPNEL